MSTSSRIRRQSEFGTWLAAAVLLIACPKPVASQSTFGGVVGAVTDSQNAVITSAAVTLTEVQTNVARNTQTTALGTYEFVNINQGLYVVEIKKEGFGAYKTQPFEVAARQTVRIDAELRPAGVQQAVQILDSAPLVNTENPTIASSKTNRELQQLPFVFRVQNTSPIPAIAILPEVQKASGNEFSLSGSMPYQNEVSVDGVLTSNVRRNGIGDGGENIFPSIETIQEIKVSSINNPAEYPQIGDITTITKSGSNSYHGTVFWNYNGTSMNANPNYFSRNLVTTTVNNNTGGSLGGRIFRDRTFFFGAFERLSILGSAIGVATVPEAAFRQGDFSSLSTPIIDPLTNAAFPGNMIPANRITAPSRAILDKFIALPNTRVNESRYGTSASTISNQYDIRVDHVFSTSHNLFGRFSKKDWDRISPTAQQASGPRTEDRPTKNIVVSDNYILRSNLINEARFGFTKADILPRTALRGRDFIAATGLQIISQNPPDISGTTYVDIAGYTRFGEAKEEPLNTENYEIADNVTWIKGRHTFKGGLNFKRFHWTSPLNFTGADDYGVFRFNNNLPRGTGNPFANFLLGLPTDVDQTQTGPGVDGIAWHYGFFFQDEWRVNTRLTVSLGMRYELHPGFKDLELNISNFLRDTPNGDVVVPNEESLKLTSPGFLASLGSTKVLTAQQAGLPESLRKTDANNFAPRIGVAWRPFGNNSTVIRSGYGIYTTRILGAVFNSLTGIHTSDNATYQNAFDAQLGRHAIVWPATASGQADRGESPVGSQNFSTANDPNYRDPYTQQWSLTIERELNRQNSLRLTYSGNHAVGLTTAPDLNQILPNMVGFSNLPRSARPYPNWNRVNTRDNGGNAHYHDFTVQLKARYVAGLSYTSSYKWAKGTSNVEDSHSGAIAGNFSEEIASRTDNRFDGRYFRGPTAAIPYHRFITDFVWDTPFGRGRRYGSSWNRALDAIAGGWTVSGIFVAQSGQHITPYTTSHCPSGTSCYGQERLDAVSGQDPNDGMKTTESWMNAAAFTNRNFFDANGRPIFIGRFGNAGKGIVDGPGLISLDAGLFKDFSMTERWRLRLQSQVRNLPNHPNFANPDLNVTSGTYNKIRALAGNASTRVIVVGARIIF
jgi:hypothetical protein